MHCVVIFDLGNLIKIVDTFSNNEKYVVKLNDMFVKGKLWFAIVIECIVLYEVRRQN